MSDLGFLAVGRRPPGPSPSRRATSNSFDYAALLADIRDAAAENVKRDMACKGKLVTQHVTVKTRSGRTFRYELSKYRFGPDLRPAKARSLALSIAHEKYRAADWDSRHSQKQAIEEIGDSLYDIIIECVGNMRANPSK
jgi:hypothetical protein